MWPFNRISVSVLLIVCGVNVLMRDVRAGTRHTSASDSASHRPPNAIRTISVPEGAHAFWHGAAHRRRGTIHNNRDHISLVSMLDFRWRRFAHDLVRCAV